MDEIQSAVDSARNLFEEFDLDGNGTIDASELQVLGAALGETWTLAQTREILKELDKDNDGTVDLKEFQDWLANEKNSEERKYRPAGSAALHAALQVKQAAFQINKHIDMVRSVAQNNQNAHHEHSGQ